MFLLPLAILESDNDLLRRNFLETNKSRIFALVVFWLGLIAFFLNFLKTPFSLTDYHHTQYIADEMQIQLTENKAYSSYAAQYSNLLGPIFGLFIHGVSPIDLEISTIWLLIILQYIGVAIFFVLIIKLGRGSQLKYSLLFSSSLLGGAFFYSQSTLDWLQNFPARTFFPILCILMISIRLKFNNLKTSVWRNLGGNSLDVLIGGLAALSIANDPIFGAPLSIAIFLITILDRENPISVKILRTCLIFCSCMIVLLSINEFFFHPSELPKDLSLFTHYIIQYSSQGFGESYSFFGPDVVFWGFAIFAILDNRTQNSTVEKQGDAINRNLTLLTALLVLSTIPYSTGRSLTPQIWASCAIYLSLLFSLQIQDLPKVRGGSQTSLYKKVLISLSLLLSLTSGLLIPNNIKSDIQRIVNGNPDYLNFSAKISAVDNELNSLLKVKNYKRSDVGIMLPFGNNLAKVNRVQNVLMANDPTSIISSQQFLIRCQKFNNFPLTVVVIDASLYPLYKSAPSCQEIWKLDTQNTNTFRDLFFVLTK
jgi:hypothetical protein